MGLTWTGPVPLLSWASMRLSRQVSTLESGERLVFKSCFQWESIYTRGRTDSINQAVEFILRQNRGLCFSREEMNQMFSSSLRCMCSCHSMVTWQECSCISLFSIKEKQKPQRLPDLERVASRRKRWSSPEAAEYQFPDCLISGHPNSWHSDLTTSLSSI